jgi:phytoene dehydrogenase-like protein
VTGEQVDAVVVGAGPNGLVAANALVDAGWDVVVVEANDRVGGAVRSAEITAPGFTSDLFSAFYPLAAASPVIRDLDLGRHGLHWTHAPAVLAHQFDDGRTVVLSRDPHRTAASVEEFGAGDGDAWLAMFEHWRRIRDPLLDALFTPFPPLAPGLRIARALGTSGLLDLARLATLPVRRLGRERFRGDGARALLTGNSMHSDVPPEAAGSGIFGWLLAMLGQDVGFPVPVGGAQVLSDALAARITSGGGRVRTGARVEAVEVAGGRTTGVRLADGTRIGVRRGVLADVDAPTLYRDLVGPAHLPGALLDDLGRFQWDHPTLKLNWALRAPVPWRAAASSGAGTVHLGVDLDGFVDCAADLTVGRAVRRPFVLFGQMSTADPSRSPTGTESAWAYSHLPSDLVVGRPPEDAQAAVDAHAERMAEAVERVAPGFADLVVGEHRQTPFDLHAADSNLAVGALNGGTAAIHQQLVFRPTPGLGRPETPIEGLYLASASAHPGGGVHGACGWNAARSALSGHGPTGAVRRRLARTAWARVLGS